MTKALAPMASKRKAFVLMPFDPDFTGIFDQIAGALSEVDFETTRADSRPDQSAILTKVIGGIRDADLIVADLTTLNPNVFYELGVAHARGAAALMLTQNIEDVPADLRSYNVFAYSTHFERMPELRQHLKTVATGLRDDSLQFRNPVTDFWGEPFTRPAPHEAGATGKGEPPREPAIAEKDASGRGPLTPDVGSADETAEEEGVSGPFVGADDAAEDGILDWQAQLEENWPLAVQIIGEIGAQTEAIGKRMGERAAEIDGTNQSSPGAAQNRRNIASKAAQDINQYTSELRKQVVRLRELQGPIEEGQLSILAHANINSAEDTAALAGMLDSADEALRGTSEGIQSMVGFRNTVDGLRHISRDMNVARLMLVPVLDGLVTELRRFESFFQKVQDIIRQRLQEEPGSAFAGA